MRFMVESDIEDEPGGKFDRCDVLTDVFRKGKRMKCTIVLSGYTLLSRFEYSFIGSITG